MITITCDHCESEIDVALDPRCVVYDPSGATDVKCADCRQREWERWQEHTLSGEWPPSITEQLREAFNTKHGRH